MDIEGSIESDYIRRLAEGSYEVFDYFYLKYASLVESFVRVLVKDGSVAEDICQEVFLNIWRSRHVLKGVSSMNNYLFIMSKNAVYDFYLKRGHPKTEEEFLTVENLPPSLKGDLQQEEDIRDFLLLVNVTVSEMPEQRRRVFCLSRKDGLKNKEIAQLTGLSEKTVEYHISKALAQLKSL